MKNFLLLSLMMSAFIVSGQITINYSDYLSAFGTGSVYKSYSTPIGGPAVSVFVGEASGSAQYWDFTGYSYEYLAISESIDPISAPLISSFPSSNIVLMEKSWLMKADTFYYWNYKELNSDRFLLHGTSDETSILFEYDPPAIHAVIPLSYGSSWQSERDSTYIMPGVYIISEHNVVADAFGTMLLPSGEYDCLRLTLNNLTISHTIMGVDTSVTRNYSFYSKGLNEVNVPTILENQFELTTIEVSGIKFSTKEGPSVTSELPSGVARAALGRNFPNPFSHLTTIPYIVHSYGPVDITVLDVLGNIIASPVHANQQPGTYEITFDASGLAAGVYYYRLNSGNLTEVKKMILKH